MFASKPISTCAYYFPEKLARRSLLFNKDSTFPYQGLCVVNTHHHRSSIHHATPPFIHSPPITITPGLKKKGGMILFLMLASGSESKQPVKPRWPPDENQRTAVCYIAKDSIVILGVLDAFFLTVSSSNSVFIST